MRIRLAVESPSQILSAGGVMTSLRVEGMLVHSSLSEQRHLTMEWQMCAYHTAVHDMLALLVYVGAVPP